MKKDPIYPIIFAPSPDVTRFVLMRSGFRDKIKKWSREKKERMLKKVEKISYPPEDKKKKVGKWNLTEEGILALKVELRRSLGLPIIGDGVKEELKRKFPGYPYSDIVEMIELPRKIAKKVEEKLKKVIKI